MPAIVKLLLWITEFFEFSIFRVAPFSTVIFWAYRVVFVKVRFALVVPFTTMSQVAYITAFE